MRKDYVIEILKKSNTPLTAKDIYNIAIKEKAVDISTIYRNLNKLIKNNEIIKTVRQDKTAYFEILTPNHTHYIICDKCHTSYPTNYCNLDNLKNAILEETGFILTSHTLEFHGICPKCLKSTN